MAVDPRARGIGREAVMRSEYSGASWVRRAAAVATAFGLAVSGARADTAAWPDRLAAGRAQVARGAYADAVATLTEVVQSADASQGRDVAWAYLSLGLAYAGLGQESPARSQFLQALKRDATIAPEPTTPAASLEIFRAAVAEARELGALGALDAKPKSKPHTLAYLALGAGLAAAGTGVAIGASHNDHGASPPSGTAPMIANVVAGDITPVDATVGVFTVQFDYSDPDGDVDRVFLKFTGFGGIADVLPDATGKRSGHAVVRSSVSLPPRGTVVTFTLDVTDSQGHLSNVLTGTTTWR